MQLTSPGSVLKELRVDRAGGDVNIPHDRATDESRLDCHLCQPSKVSKARYPSMLATGLTM